MQRVQNLVFIMFEVGIESTMSIEGGRDRRRGFALVFEKDSRKECTLEEEVPPEKNFVSLG